MKLLERAPPKVDMDTKVSRCKRKPFFQIKCPCQISTSKFLRHVRCPVAHRQWKQQRAWDFSVKGSRRILRGLYNQSHHCYATMQNKIFYLLLAFLTVRVILTWTLGRKRTASWTKRMLRWLTSLVTWCVYIYNILIYNWKKNDPHNPSEKQRLV